MSYREKETNAEKWANKIEKKEKPQFKKRTAYMKEYTKTAGVLLYIEDQKNIFQTRIPQLLATGELSVSNVAYNNTLSGYLRYLIKKDFESAGLEVFNPVKDMEFSTHYK